MMPVQLKISDLALVTGYTRFQVDGLIKQVFGQSLGKIAGAQRTYSPRDLLVVAVASQIEQRFATDRKALARVGDALRAALNGPRSANRDARLVVTFDPPSVVYLDRPVAVEEGIVIKLGSVFAKVDGFLGLSGNEDMGAQSPLPMAPTLVSGKRSSRNV
jgi:hypothetical protein